MSKCGVWMQKRETHVHLNIIEVIQRRPAGLIWKYWKNEQKANL